MKAAVANVFFRFSTSFEGHCSWMYCDVKGYVTTGIGNLIDPIEAALALPWCIQGDPTQPADVDSIAVAWHAVKARTDLYLAGGGAFAPLTNLRLTESAIDNLVQGKATDNEIELRKHFPDYDDLPADAQLGVLSMAWAMGADFAPGYPKFTAAVNACDFVECAAQCSMDATGNPGLRPRNTADVKLFTAAAAVVSNHGDPDVLTGWP